MHVPSPAPDPERAAKRRDFVLRAAVLGTLYVLAVAFAVAFSPSAGIAPMQAGSEANNVAATPSQR